MSPASEADERGPAAVNSSGCAGHSWGICLFCGGGSTRLSLKAEQERKEWRWPGHQRHVRLRLAVGRKEKRELRNNFGWLSIYRLAYRLKLIPTKTNESFSLLRWANCMNCGPGRTKLHTEKDMARPRPLANNCCFLYSQHSTDDNILEKRISNCAVCVNRLGHRACMCAWTGNAWWIPVVVYTSRVGTMPWAQMLPTSTSLASDSTSSWGNPLRLPFIWSVVNYKDCALTFQLWRTWQAIPGKQSIVAIRGFSRTLMTYWWLITRPCIQLVSQSISSQEAKQ